MATPPSTTVRCNTCGTEFPSTDTDAMQEHQDHDLVHIEQG